jgi:AI-2 transport protein TqsA
MNPQTAHGPGVHSVALARIPAILVSLVLLGYLLKIGQSLLLPIVLAIIVTLVLDQASVALGRVPVVGRLPVFARHIVLFLLFLALVGFLGLILSGTISQITAAAPRYQANLDKLLTDIAGMFRVDRAELWRTLQARISSTWNLQTLTRFTFGSITNLGSMLLLVALYAAFLAAERTGFPRKLAGAVRDPERANRMFEVLNHITGQIREYLLIKTLINLLLAVICYVILRLMGVDFALFWALMIGLLNYIPYVGSYAGVIFPVLLSLAQFGNLTTPAVLAALLTAAQFVVGNVIEPRWIGNRVNLSPFVVLVALSVWSALWGLPGAILAIPLTSMISIVCAAFDEMRWVSVLLSNEPSAVAAADMPASLAMQQTSSGATEALRP